MSTSEVDAGVPAFSGLSAVVEDQRCSPRNPNSVPVRLSGLGSSESHPCIAKDISEGGLYLRVPASADLAVGQRCELTFSDDELDDAIGGLAGCGCYATVVRTEQDADGLSQSVGAGLRFDRPLFL